MTGAAALADRVAIVTGSSTGIGRAIAAELAGRGATVVVTSRSSQRAAAAAAGIAVAGGRATAAAGELTDAGAPAALVARTLDEHGRIDVLVNCAGAGQVAPSADLPLSGWQQIIDLDLTAPFACAQAVAGPMLA